MFYTLLSWYVPFTFFISICYAVTIALYLYFWRRTNDFIVPITFVPKTTITIIIPARNEENKINICIDAIMKGSYSPELFEIIVVDDFSDDETASVVRALNYVNVRVIQLEHFIHFQKNTPYKKRAIQTAIGLATGDLIVTTDADTKAQKNWLRTIAAFYELESKKFVAAPVNFYNENNLLQKFQSLDYIGMMGVTAAGIKGNFTHICNGANLAYEKKLFYAVDGFNDIDHVASGDDVLLMQKIARRYGAHTIGFLKNYDAVVFTEAEHSWESFIQQRRRWATKSSSYTEIITLLQLALVYVLCCIIVLNTFAVVIFFPKLWVLYLPLIIKTVSDYFFQRPMMHYFKRTDLLRYFLRSEMLHISYIVYVGTVAQFKKTYNWKGRVTR